MTGCLSDRALARVQVELASDDERAHLASCAGCARRARRLRVDLELVTRVLSDTPEPRPRTADLRRRWMPAAFGLSAAALALLLWVEVAVWRAVTPPATMQPQEVAAILSDVSASLFSLSGTPAGGGSATGASGEADETPQTLEAMAQELDNTLTGGEP